ncbi:MAG: VWA domain-containing protein [Hyphomonadaceae bacterium]|nr:VWA domain-containing protein [Hyphomonadaceae bacterium]
MIMGSCAAALMASFIVFPVAMDSMNQNKPPVEYVDISNSKDPEKTDNISSSMNPAETIVRVDEKKSETTPAAPKVEISEVLVTGNRKDKSNNVAEAPVKNVTERDAIVAPASPIESRGGIVPDYEALGRGKPSDTAQANVRPAREAEFRAQAGQQSAMAADSMRPRVKRIIAEPVYVEPKSRNQFEDFDPNPVSSVTDKPVSTFSIDVDTASYSFLRASINRGQLPPANAIRLEELINYFPYDYEAPRSAKEPFKANVTVTPTPWNADTKLMHIGIKGYVPPVAEKPRSNIVFLIDTSGSMNADNKLPLLINSFKLLLGTLDTDDTVSIVTYAGSAGTVLEPTPASDKSAINSALNRLRAGGSTAGAAGLELAYLKAQESFDDEGINRVILATDGDFNVGFSSPDEMKTFVEKKRKTGIFLSVLGFGNGNYNDHLMQSLAQNGNGVAAYIDSLAEANKVLANEAGSALITIAKDVKIQVEFNPATISEYRLIGYETRALNREDFNNDAVDAGEINSGHSVTAIYELTPVGSPAQMVDDLRYVKDKPVTVSTGSDELAFVKIRHKLPNADKSTLQTFPVDADEEKSLARAGDDTRFAVAVAAVGQKLRGDTQLTSYSYKDAIELANSAKGEDEHGYRSEFIQLVRLAETLQDK